MRVRNTVGAKWEQVVWTNIWLVEDTLRRNALGRVDVVEGEKRSIPSSKQQFLLYSHDNIRLLMPDWWQ